MAILWAFPAAGAGPVVMFPEARWHIALDPGHGGDDTGARGPTGLEEKTVCLELSRILALRLEEGFRVTLTRSDDYHVRMRQRAAIANQSKANLFISLHTGASFQHAVRETAIYYHAPAGKTPEQPSGASTDPGQSLAWHQVQARHLTASQALAKAMQGELVKHLQGQEVRVASAPLAQLEGADMPAILIEVGQITHPATEQRMATIQGLENLARAIDAAIKAYIQERGGGPRP